MPAAALSSAPEAAKSSWGVDAAARVCLQGGPLEQMLAA